MAVRLPASSGGHERARRCRSPRGSGRRGSRRRAAPARRRRASGAGPSRAGTRRETADGADHGAAEQAEADGDHGEARRAWRRGARDTRRRRPGGSPRASTISGEPQAAISERDDHPATPGTVGAAGEHLDEVEVAHVGEGLDVHLLEGLLLAHAASETRPIASPDGYAEEIRPFDQPAVTRIWPSLDLLVVLDEVEQQVLGVADLGLDDARRARSGSEPRRDGAAVVGDQRHLSGAARWSR